MLRRFLAALVAVVMSCGWIAAWGQAYPSRMVRIILPFPAGSPTDRSDSPHLALANAEGKLCCGFSKLDPFASEETIWTIGETMCRAKANYRFEIHAGADHGYALPERDIYDKSAANRDSEIIFSMFDRQLRTAAP